MSRNLNGSLFLNEKLIEMHSTIAKLLHGKRVAYVDIPVHFNVGDLLIYLGTEEFFKKHNINVVYRSEVKGCSMSALSKVDAIVLHGGGNFGDLYPVHHKFRERIAGAFKDKLLICLPQTIHFDSVNELEDSAQIFIKHSEFHLFVRDRESLILARKFTDKVMLMPDMAHNLSSSYLLRKIKRKERRGAGRESILHIKRRDQEKGVLSNNIENSVVFDWDDLINTREVFLLRMYQIFRFIKPTLAIDLWYVISNYLLAKSCKLFEKFDIIHSDRLHGLIFSVILDKQYVVYDNSYGKNLAYYRAFLQFSPLTDISSSHL